MIEREKLLQVKQEITKDEYADYIKDGRHYDLANKFNDTMVLVDQPVSIKLLNSFADSNGLLIILEDVVSDTENKYSTEIKKAARAILRVFIAKYDTVDLTLPAVNLAFGGLVAANILTQEVVDQIYSLGKAYISLAQVKFGFALTSWIVADALKIT